MKRVVCLILSLSLMAGLGLGASAQSSAPDAPPDSSEVSGPMSSSADSAPQEETSADEPSQEDPAPQETSSADAAESGAPAETPEPPSPEETPPDGPGADARLVIDSVARATEPAQLDAAGGSAVFTVRGTHLEKENIWIKLEKDGVPFATERFTEYAGLWDTVRNELLSFAGQNLTELSTREIALEPGGPEAFTVYQAYILHTPDAGTPAANDPDWSYWPEAGVVLPKATPDEPAPPTVGASDGSSSAAQESGPEQEPAGNQGDEAQEDEYIGVDLPDTPSGTERPTVGVSESDPGPAKPGLPGETVPPAPSEPQQPEGPGEQQPSGGSAGDAPAAIIAGVTSSVVPDPLTYAGGGITVAVTGENLAAAGVWVRVRSGDTTAIERAEGDGAAAYTKRVPLGENLTGKPVGVEIAALLGGAQKPAADDPAWQVYDGAAAIIPPARGVPQDQEEAPFAIGSVQSVTVPGEMTYTGGSVTVAAAGTGFAGQKLWVKLDGGGDPIVKKLTVTGGTALSPEIRLPANESASRDAVYTVSILAADTVGTPRATGSGWKRFPEADVTVPRIPQETAPVIDGVEYTETTLDGGPAVIFTLTGEHLGGAPVWVKAAPKGESHSAKILPAEPGEGGNTASTAPLSTKARKSVFDKTASNETVRFDVYAMVKLDGKKPAADDKGWKRLGTSAALSATAQPKLTRVTADTAVLPSAGGTVRIAAEGENLDALGDAEFFVRMEEITEGGRTGQPVDKNARGGAAVFTLPANPSATHNVTYRYSTYLKSEMREWGTVTVSRGLGVTVETFDENGAPGALTSAGGSIRCGVEGETGAAGSVWVRVSGNGSDEIRFASETFAVAPNGSPTDSREIRVQMMVSPLKPDASDSGWELLETFVLPAINDGHPEASVSSAYIEGTPLSSEGGTLRVTFEGEGLDAAGLHVFARLRKADTGDYDDIVAPAAPGGEFRVTAALAVPVNTSPAARRYALEYCLSYSEEAPSQAVWMTAAIPETAREVVVPRAASAGAPAIGAAALSGDVIPLSTTGGKVTVTVTGQNLDRENVWLQLRCAQDPMRDDQLIAAAAGPDAASATFTIDPSESERQYSYSVWALTSPESDGEAAAALAGWREVAAFYQKARLGEASVTSIDADLPGGEGGTARVTARGNNLRGRSLFMQIVPEGTDADAAPVVKMERRSGDETYEAAAPVAYSASDGLQLARVSVLSTESSIAPTAQEVQENGVSTVAASGSNDDSVTIAGITVDPADIKAKESTKVTVFITLGYSTPSTPEYEGDIFYSAKSSIDGSAIFGKATKIDKSNYRASVELKADREKNITYTFGAGFSQGSAIDSTTTASVLVRAGAGTSTAAPEISSITLGLSTISSDGENMYVTVKLTEPGYTGEVFARAIGGQVTKISKLSPKSDPYTFAGNINIPSNDTTDNITFKVEVALEENKNDNYIYKGNTFVQLGQGNANNSNSSDDTSSDDTSSGGDTSTTVDGEVSDTVLRDAMKKAEDSNADEVILSVTDDDIVLSKEFFEEADDYKKDIIIKGDGYEWTIPKWSDVRRMSKGSFNLTVEGEDAKYENEMQDLAGSRADIYPFYIHYHGTLPTTMYLTIYTEYDRRTDVWVYRYDEEEDDATLIAEETVGTDGKVRFKMTRCSYYFISDRRVINAKVDSDEDSRSIDKEDIRDIDDIDEISEPSRRNPGTGAKNH